MKNGIKRSVYSGIFLKSICTFYFTKMHFPEILQRLLFFVIIIQLKKHSRSLMSDVHHRIAMTQPPTVCGHQLTSDGASASPGMLSACSFMCSLCTPPATCKHHASDPCPRVKLREKAPLWYPFIFFNHTSFPGKEFFNNTVTAAVKVLRDQGLQSWVTSSRSSHSTNLFSPLSFSFFPHKVKMWQSFFFFLRKMRSQQWKGLDNCRVVYSYVKFTSSYRVSGLLPMVHMDSSGKYNSVVSRF